MGNEHKRGDGQAASDPVDKSAASCYDSFRLRTLFKVMSWTVKKGRLLGSRLCYSGSMH